MDTKNRKEWLDSLRGVAMLLVVYGHSVQGWTDYFVFSSPIKMPLFFAISGYLFKPRGGDQKMFYKSIFLKLIVPWIVFGMFPYTNPERIVDLISGKITWFLPCLIIGEIIWFYIHKFSKKDFHLLLYGLLACIFGFILNHFKLFHFAMVDNAFIVQIFFVLGYFIRKYELKCLERNQYLLSILSLTYLILGIVSLLFFQGQSLDVHHNRYYNIPICAIMIVAGCIILFNIFREFNISSKWLVFIGQNTMVIYLVHMRFFKLFDLLLDFFKIDLGLPLQLQGLLITIFACISCCILACFINKYLPEIVGKKR